LLALWAFFPSRKVDKRRSSNLQAPSGGTEPASDVCESFRAAPLFQRSLSFPAQILERCGVKRCAPKDAA
jgi:hypothetical protein